MAQQKIIVFGATGLVGSQVVKAALNLGADVVLAVRDTSAPIRGLPSPESTSGKYERKQADLTNPDSIRAVIRETQAKQAFLYQLPFSQDHMASAIEALKDSGIENVVFLASFLLRDFNVAPSEILPWSSAQVEKNLIKAFPNYVSLRPGGFATNTLRWQFGPQVEIYDPEGARDWIAHSDIGDVAANILLHGSQGVQAVYLFGPHLVSQREALSTIGKVFDKKFEVKAIDRDTSTSQMQALGYPLPLALYLTDPNVLNGSYDGILEEGVANVQKFTGHKATAFEDWVRDNKDLFEGKI